MPNNIILKASSKLRKNLTRGTVVTKDYDGGDSSLIKSYSHVHVSYKINGIGISPLECWYRIESSNWKRLEAVATNPFSVQTGVTSTNSGIAKFKRTNGSVNTAEFKLPRKEKGRSISLKFYLSTIGAEGTSFEGFVLSDITFTFRTIARK